MTINLDDAAFDRGRADVREAAHRLRSARDRAAPRVTGFLEAGWSGLAADAYTEAFEDWRMAAQRVEDGLTAMAELMDATQRDLHARDAAASQVLG
jgi:WXG100 family type VII secretion target